MSLDINMFTTMIRDESQPAGQHSTSTAMSSSVTLEPLRVDKSTTHA